MSSEEKILKEQSHNRLWIIIYFVVIALVYAGLFSAPSSDASFDLINRSIDPPFRNIFNGWLGSFFYFKYLGPLIWIIIPGVLVLFYRRRFSYNHRHLLWIIPVLMMAFFIAFIAHINYRYHLTLFPLFTCVAFWFLSMMFKEDKIRERVFMGVLVLQILNSFFFIAVDLYPKYKNRISASLNNSKDHPEVFDYINKNLGAGDRVYVDNLPEFFVKTRQAGLFGWSGSKVYYDVHGKHAFPVDIGSNSLRRMLADTLHCNYFFVHENLKEYRGGFQEFLDEQTRCAFADSAGYRLYELIPE